MADILFAEQTLQFDADVNYENVTQLRTDMSENIIVLTPGNVYTVIWDGTKHECVAKNVNFFNGDEVEIGNTNIVGIEDDSNEPFVLGYSPSMQMNLIYASGNAETHTVAIYRGTIEEEKVGANIVLYDRNGNPVTYEDIETVTFNTDVDEETATYTFGTAVNDVPVELDLSDGDQTVKAAAGKMIKSAVVKKPETLLPENIKKGVEIAGVAGELIGTGVAKTVELDMADGDQTVKADNDTLMSEVVIKKPDTLLPENIAEGVTVAGVVGNAPLNDFDTTDENLKALGYHLDMDKKEVEVRLLSYPKLYELTGGYNVTIPDTLGNYPVVIEADFFNRGWGNFFFTNANVENISIGQNVRFANNTMANMFSNCVNLKSKINIPDGITNLRYILNGCRYFNHPVSIPNTVKDMYGMFNNCGSFNQLVEIPDGVKTIVNMFTGCYTYNKPVKIPNSVTHIDSFMSGCTNFNQPINIPNGVTNMPYAFQSCFNFNQPVNIPGTVENAWFVFSKCNNFNSPVDIAEGVKDIYGLFNSCIKFNQPVVIPNSVNTVHALFNGCTLFNQPISIPNGVTDARNMCINCTSLNQPVVIGAGVTNAVMMLYNCKNMSGDITVYARNLSNVVSFLYGKNNSKRINIYIPAGSTTETRMRYTNTYSIVGKALAWTNDVSNNCFYNASYNIYIYNTL